MDGKKGFRKVLLSDILEWYPLEEFSHVEPYKLLCPAARFLYKFTAEDAVCQNAHRVSELKESCIVWTLSLYHGMEDAEYFYFDSSKGSIFIDSCSLAWTIKDDGIDIGYLLMELAKHHDEYVEDFNQAYLDHPYCFEGIYIDIPEGDEEFSLYEQQRIFNEFRQKEVEKLLHYMGSSVDVGGNMPSGTIMQEGRLVVNEYTSGGGFGKLYKATAKFPTHRQNVALKELFVKEYCTRRPLTNDVEVMSTHTKDFERQKDKFRIEYDILRTLGNHTNYVPRVYGPIHQEHGTLYYMMQYVENGTVWQHTRNQDLSAQQLLRVICQAGIALHHAHDMDYLHLDVTPLNIMVDDALNGVLIDFGNSKHYSIYDACITSVGQTAKTKSFAAPELMRQVVGEYYMQSDVYALAITLYAVLTGNIPYLRYDEKDDLFVETIHKEMNEEGLDETIQQAILRGISYHYEDRQPTVRDFLLDLLPALEDATLTDEIRSLQPVRGFHQMNHKASIRGTTDYDYMPTIESE